MPPAMPWMKLYSEMLDDPKIGALSDTLKWRFIEMCLLASESDEGGWLTNGDHRLSVQEVAWRLRQPCARLKIDIEKLVKMRLLESSDVGIFVVNFAKRQGRPSKERREQAKIRQQRFRQTHASRVTNALQKALVTPLEVEEEEDKEVEGADAPESPKSPIVIWKEITGQNVPVRLHEMVSDALTSRPDEKKLKSVFTAWIGRGYSPKNIAGILDWYKTNIPPQGGNKQRETVRVFNDE